MRLGFLILSLTDYAVSGAKLHDVYTTVDTNKRTNHAIQKQSG